MTRPTAIYYPGVASVSENGALNALRRAGHRRCLISCAAYRGSLVDRVVELEDDGFTVIVDSGIYTLLYGPAKREVTPERCREFFDRWLETARAVAERTSRAILVEWDAQSVVGLETVRNYRRAAQSQIPLERMMYVWHRSDGTAGLTELAGRYVGVSLVGDSGGPEYMRKTARLAAEILRSLGSKIHLLGTASLPILRSMSKDGLFDSFDSASWCAESRFGSPESASVVERYLIFSKQHVLSHEYLLLKELHRLQEFVVKDT